MQARQPYFYRYGGGRLIGPPVGQAKDRQVQFFWSRSKRIAQAEDAYGVLWVEQQGRKRYLVFGEDSEQSLVNMRKPLRLEYEYSRAMLLGGLCHDSPETALFLGLGSGVLLRACLAAMPGIMDAEVIELRPEVLRLARDYMGFVEDARMTIRLGDALELLPTAEKADLIFLDLYDEQGPSRAHMAWDFLERCHALLEPDGWLVINQWALPDSKPLATPLLRGLFHNHYWELPVSEGNVILLVPADTTQNLPVSALRERARAVGKRLGFPLEPLLANVRLPVP